jgi:hypothetical protein
MVRELLDFESCFFVVIGNSRKIKDLVFLGKVLETKFATRELWSNGVRVWMTSIA